MGTIPFQITSLAIVYSAVYSDADQRQYQSSESLAFVRGIHRRPVNSPHKWPVTREVFPFDDVIMQWTLKQLRSTAISIVSSPNGPILLTSGVRARISKYIPADRCNHLSMLHALYWLHIWKNRYLIIQETLIVKPYNFFSLCATLCNYLYVRIDALECEHDITIRDTNSLSWAKIWENDSKWQCDVIDGVIITENISI